jgi:hypothetical protein
MIISNILKEKNYQYYTLTILNITEDEEVYIHKIIVNI